MNQLLAVQVIVLVVLAACIAARVWLACRQPEPTVVSYRMAEVAHDVIELLSDNEPRQRVFRVSGGLDQVEHFIGDARRIDCRANAARACQVHPGVWDVTITYSPPEQAK